MKVQLSLYLRKLIVLSEVASSWTFYLFSGSMKPAFFPGDLLLLTNNREEPIRAGDIVVFRIEGRDIPIVHRVLKVHEKYIFQAWNSICHNLSSILELTDTLNF